MFNIIYANLPFKKKKKCIFFLRGSVALAIINDALCANVLTDHVDRSTFHSAVSHRFEFTPTLHTSYHADLTHRAIKVQREYNLHQDVSQCFEDGDEQFNPALCA